MGKWANNDSNVCNTLEHDDNDNSFGYRECSDLGASSMFIEYWLQWFRFSKYNRKNMNVCVVRIKTRICNAMCAAVAISWIIRSLQFELGPHTADST